MDSKLLLASFDQFFSCIKGLLELFLIAVFNIRTNSSTIIFSSIGLTYILAQAFIVDYQ